MTRDVRRKNETRRTSCSIIFFQNHAEHEIQGRENTMHSILKRSAALIASAGTLGGGMLMAGTAQADGIGLPVMTIHPAASTSYPKELVNGGFRTFGKRIVDKRSGGSQ